MRDRKELNHTMYCTRITSSARNRCHRKERYSARHTKSKAWSILICGEQETNYMHVHVHVLYIMQCCFIRDASHVCSPKVKLQMDYWNQNWRYSRDKTNSFRRGWIQASRHQKINGKAWGVFSHAKFFQNTSIFRPNWTNFD